MQNPPDHHAVTVATVYLHAGGLLDPLTTPHLRERIEHAFRQTDNQVELGCSEITFIDSGGLRLLLEMTREADARGVRLLLVDPSPSLRRLVCLAGVGDCLHIDGHDPGAVDRQAGLGTGRGPTVHGFPVAHSL